MMTTKMDELPDGWAWTTLEEIRVDRSKSINPAKMPEEMFELYSVPSMSDGEPEQTLGSDIGSSKRTVHEGTVLLCKINPRINRVWIVKNHTPHQKIASTEWIPFSQTEAFEPKYLQYYLQQDAFRDFLAQNASGVGGSLMRVKPTTFADYPMPIAPLEEQKRIVEAIETQFTRLDQATAVLQRLQQNIQRYRASVLKYACEGRLLPQDPRDEPADQLLQRILAERRRQWEADAWQKEIERAQKKAATAVRKAAGKSTKMRDIPDAEWQALPAEAYTSYLPQNDKWKQKYQEPPAPDTADLPELPTGWLYVDIQPLLSLKRVGMKTGPFGSLLKKHEHTAMGVPVLGIENIDSMKFIAGSKIHITEEKAKALEAYDIQGGDIIISRSGTVGEICVIPQQTGQARFSTNLMRIVLNQKIMHPVFFATLFNGSPFILDQVSELCSGSTRDFLNQKILYSLIFQLPPLAEQKRIVEEIERRLSLLDALEETITTSLRRAQRLRQAILKRAFSGQLVPQNPHDEPAADLLKRIKQT